MKTPAEPFKIMGNLYFVGVANGEVYLLTSPKGHILFGAAFSRHYRPDREKYRSYGLPSEGRESDCCQSQPSGSGRRLRDAESKKRRAVDGGIRRSPLSGAWRRASGGNVDSRTTLLPRVAAAYPPVHVDRALYDGDVVTVGPLKFTAYLAPGHSPSSTSFLYTVKDNGREYRVFEFCCWEYPDDLSRNIFITEAGVRHNLELFRKVLPVDIYLETGAYGWSGILNQSSGTILERMAKLKQDNKLFANPDIFKSWSAAREVEFEQKLIKLRESNPVYRQ